MCQPTFLGCPVNSWMKDVIDYAYQLFRLAMLILGLLAAYVYLLWMVWVGTFYWAESGKDIDVDGTVETHSIGVGVGVVETRSVGIRTDVAAKTRSIGVGEGGEKDPGRSRVEGDEGASETERWTMRDEYELVA